MSEITLSTQVSGSPVDLLSPIDQAVTFAYDQPVLTGVIAVSAAITLVIGYFAVRAAYRAGSRAVRKFAENRPTEDVLTIIAASIATIVSAQGMWQFVGRIIGDVHWSLRGLMFAFLEIAVVTSAVRAKRNMRENYSAGIDGAAVWGLTGLSAVLSALEAASIPEFLFRLAAPLVAAWLWERGMAIERHRITGRSRIKWRFTPERAMVRLGLAEVSDRTAADVDAHRRLTRVALSAKKVHQLRQAGAKKRKLAAAVAKRDRMLDQAVEHTDLARNKTAQKTLLDLVTALGGADTLSEIVGSASAPWCDLDHPAVTGRVRESEAVMLAAALNLYTAARTGGLSPDLPVATGDRSATAPETGRAFDAAAPGDGAELPSPSPESRSWLASFKTWSRPGSRPVATPASAANEPPAPVAESVVKPAANEQVVATDTRPVADREKPTEQDRKRAIRFYIQRAKKLNPPSKRTLADWTGFSETWALGCIQEGRQTMIAEGWSFDERGTPTPPRPVAEPVATAPTLDAEEPSLNGSAPVTP